MPEKAHRPSQEDREYAAELAQRMHELMEKHFLEPLDQRVTAEVRRLREEIESLGITVVSHAGFTVDRETGDIKPSMQVDLYDMTDLSLRKTLH